MTKQEIDDLVKVRRKFRFIKKSYLSGSDSGKRDYEMKISVERGNKNSYKAFAEKVLVNVTDVGSSYIEVTDFNLK